MRLALLSSRLLLLVLFTLSLSSCGGGGTGSPLDDAVGAVDPEAPPAVGMTLALASAASGLSTSTINVVEPGILSIALVDLNTNLPLGGQVVTVTVLAGDPVITPDSGQVLTSSSTGIATLSISPGTSQPGAAILLLADSDVDGDGTTDVSETIGFTIGSANIALGFEADGDYVVLETLVANLNQVGVGNGTNDFPDLGATGTTQLDVGVYNVDTGTLITTPVTVDFESSCGAATIDTGVITVNGVARSTFAADPACSAVTITASLAELGGASATGTITVLATAINSIRFDNANPTDLVLAGTGGTQTSEVTFQVVDNAGAGKPNITVDFSLSTAVGGLNLTNDSGISDSQGFVVATLNAGSVPSAVQVVATAEILDPITSLPTGETVSAVSNSLVVSTGLPDQIRFSASASILNPGGGDINGVETEITVFASDKFANPVPDDTVIAFTAEFGQIESPCRISSGSCSVIWRSAGGSAQPVEASTGTYQLIASNNLTNCPGVYPGSGPCLNVGSFPNNQLYSGRNSILATTLGEETFIDANGTGLYDWVDADGDGIYDPGETLEVFTDLDEAFVDKNEDGVFGNANTVGACTSAVDPDGPECANWITGGAEDIHVETFTGLVGNGEFDRGNGIYNGRLCHPDLEALNLCTFDPILVRSEVVVVMSGSAPVLSLRQAGGVVFDGLVDLTAAASETITVYLADFQNGRLPAGTEITISADNCEVSGATTFTTSNLSAPGFETLGITLTPDDTSSTGVVSVLVETPDTVGSVVGSATISCND